MRHRSSVHSVILALAAIVLSPVACSGDNETPAPLDDVADTVAVGEVSGGIDAEIGADEVRRAPPRLGPPSPNLVATPSAEGPITTGNGQIVLVPPTFDLAAVGYVEEEYFLSGDASSYASDQPLSEDGRWAVAPADSMPYTTRIIVRRPAAAAVFDGTVVIEWFNVSGGLDASPDWTFTHNQIIRAGSAWVGVSAQEAGIEGGGNPMGAMMALKNVDPVRYGPLDHPGDDFSYDIFSQAGAAVWFAAETVLGGLEPELVIAVGESQSAFRLTTYINGIAPLVDVYDGYLVHLPGSSSPLSPALDDEWQRCSSSTYLRVRLVDAPRPRRRLLADR